MTDTRKVIENKDTDSTRRSDRILDLKKWDKEQAQRIAEEEGIELTDMHWKVVYCLREYYLDHGPAKNGRELDDMLVNKFSKQGGRKYLHSLFPHGPVAQSMRIAGLRIPPYTEDKSFGTSY